MFLTAKVSTSYMKNFEKKYLDYNDLMKKIFF